MTIDDWLVTVIYCWWQLSMTIKPYWQLLMTGRRYFTEKLLLGLHIQQRLHFKQQVWPVSNLKWMGELLAITIKFLLESKSFGILSQKNVDKMKSCKQRILSKIRTALQCTVETLLSISTIYDKDNKLFLYSELDNNDVQCNMHY